MSFLLLPSDPAVTSNALAIRISFPLIGAVPASSSRTEVLATLGKPKRGSSLAWELPQKHRY
jgi:hypothetical protein